MVLVGDLESAQDIVQDAFTGLYRAWPRLRDPEKAPIYLRAAVLNGARSVLRSRRRRQLLRLPYDPPVWSAEAAVMVREDQRAVLAAIARLSPRQREVLALRYYSGLSHAEIAECELTCCCTGPGALATCRAGAAGDNPRAAGILRRQHGHRPGSRADRHRARHRTGQHASRADLRLPCRGRQ
jgi:hypothetical protein